MCWGRITIGLEACTSSTWEGSGAAAKTRLAAQRGEPRAPAPLSRSRSSRLLSRRSLSRSRSASWLRVRARCPEWCLGIGVMVRGGARRAWRGRHRIGAGGGDRDHTMYQMLVRVGKCVVAWRRPWAGVGLAEHGARPFGLRAVRPALLKSRRGDLARGRCAKARVSTIARTCCLALCDAGVRGERPHRRGEEATSAGLTFGFDRAGARLRDVFPRRGKAVQKVREGGLGGRKSCLPTGGEHTRALTCSW